MENDKSQKILVLGYTSANFSLYIQVLFQAFVICCNALALKLRSRLTKIIILFATKAL